MSQKKRLLLIEDDLELSSMIEEFLTLEGFEVQCADNGLSAIEVSKALQPDLIILDIMLPGLNGIDACRQIRQQYSGPIMMMTAKDDDIVEVTSLNAGANSYLTKPVRPHVLLAHVNAQLRQISKEAIQKRSIIQVQDLSVDPEALSAKMGDTELTLTNAEFNLLLFFAERIGQTITRDDLYQNLRGIEYDGIDRAMDMQISVLRRKMHDEQPPYKYIKTVRLKGYMLASR